MDEEIERIPRLLIPDTSPLSLLSMAGRDALDYLFVPQVEVWITDMVAIEATRDPDPDDDRRTEQRKLLADWLADNSHRIRVMETAVGREYEKAMTNWRMGGSVPDLKPSWKGRGDYSLLDVLSVAETVVDDSEAVVLLVDDRRARAALRQTENLNLDILSTRAFIDILETEFGIENASDIWTIIEIGAGVNEHGKSKVPDPLLEDPLYVRKP
ncbi:MULTISPECIES: hypothetical protein [unclassified Rhizobium]|jgi:hypothetical protein|uniref:hypothetical protein n=1 Tax=unclassified Rhizobium TaxID=2613769 RepID=UPI000DD90122|nr:hypothetical protein [Rhizobium sp. UBA1881]